MEKCYEAKIAIVGLGILGSSVLRELLQAGERDIVAIEREENFGGASAHSFGMLRVYHDSANLRDLALQSHQIVMDSPERTLAEETPFLSIRSDSAELRDNVALLDQVGYPMEILSPQAMASDYGIKAEAEQVGVLEPAALTFDPPELLQAIHHATLDQVEVVRDSICCVIENANSVDLITQRGVRVRASKLIVAAGVGSIPLLAGRCNSYRPKKIAYQIAHQSVELPQILNSGTREFISQRKGKTYYHLNSPAHYLSDVELRAVESHESFDISSEISNESFGQVPGSKRMFFMGAWSGNAFKLSWRLSQVVAESILAKKIPLGVTHEKASLI